METRGDRTFNFFSLAALILPIYSDDIFFYRLNMHVIFLQCVNLMGESVHSSLEMFFAVTLGFNKLI